MSLWLLTPMLRAGDGTVIKVGRGVGYRNKIGGFLYVECEKTSKVVGPWRGTRVGKFGTQVNFGSGGPAKLRELVAPKKAV